MICQGHRRGEAVPGTIYMRDEAAPGISGALAAGALSALPIVRFPLDDIAAAQDAVEAGTVAR